jgi:hypothetical protein
MTWADFYLICFVGGFAFSLISFLAGGTWHFHLPHLPHGVGHVPVAGHAGPIAVGHVGGGAVAGHAPVVAGHAPATDVGQSPAHAMQPASVSPFNFVTLTAFLAWFGGTGYLLTRYSRVWFVVGLGIALVSGLVGAAIVFLFLSKVLTSEEETMDPADYRMVGVLGRTSIPIRAGGTGEIIYSQAGTRRTCGARSEEGVAIAKGVEVVVTQYEKGIAYVRLWTEISGEESTTA